MRGRLYLVAVLVAGLAWPVLADEGGCRCNTQSKARPSCCPDSKPTPAQTKKGCCTVAPQDPSNREALKTEPPLLPAASRSASVLTLDLFADDSSQRYGSSGFPKSGDPPGDSPPLHLSNCTFRI